MLAGIDKQDGCGGVDVGHERQQHRTFSAERGDDGDAAGEIRFDGAAQGRDAVMPRAIYIHRCVCVEYQIVQPVGAAAIEHLIPHAAQETSKVLAAKADMGI